MSKSFVYTRLDVLSHGKEYEQGDGQYVRAEDAINREAVLQAEIRTLQTQLKDARGARLPESENTDPLRRRVERLLIDLHASDTLSEGQCAKVLGIDRISWRKIEDESAFADQGRTGCNLGVGCDEAGVCYAMAHGAPEQCGAVETVTPKIDFEAERKLFEAAVDGIEIDLAQFDWGGYRCGATQAAFNGWIYCVEKRSVSPIASTQKEPS